MADLRHSFDPVFFTQEEKEQLTARLLKAAASTIMDRVALLLRRCSSRINIEVLFQPRLFHQILHHILRHGGPADVA